MPTLPRRSPLRLGALAVAAASGLVLTAGPALADTVVRTGNTTGGPTFNRALENCTGPSGFATAVAYGSRSLTVGTASTYTVSLSTPSHDGYLHLYEAPFDPSAPLERCIAGNDDAGSAASSRLTAALAEGTEYVLVVSGFSDNDAGPFELTVSGPGTVTVDGSDAPAPVVPEVPVAVLLPLAALGIGALALRRRGQG